MVSVRSTTLLRRASDRKMFASVLLARSSRILNTSYRTIVGTSTRAPLWKISPKAPALSSPVRYSSQPEESTSTGSEAIIAIPVVIFPLRAFDYSAQFCDRPWLTESNRSVHDVDVQFLTRLQLKLFSHLLAIHNLKFRGNLHCLHDRTHEKFIDRPLRMSISISIVISCCSRYLQAAKELVRFVGGVEVGFEISGGKALAKVVEAACEKIERRGKHFLIGEHNVAPGGIRTSRKPQRIAQARTSQRNGQTVFVKTVVEKPGESDGGKLRKMR